MTGSPDTTDPLDRSGSAASLLGSLGLAPGAPTRTESQRRRFRETVMDGTGWRAIVLDDVELAGCRHRVHHVVLAPRGVWVVATVGDEGPIEVRDLGGFFRSEIRLHIGGRDHTATVDALVWQQAAVAGRLSTDPCHPSVHSALVVADEQDRSNGNDDPVASAAGPIRLEDVWVTRSTAFGLLVGSPDPDHPDLGFEGDDLTRLARLLVGEPTAPDPAPVVLDLTRYDHGSTHTAGSSPLLS